MTRPPRKATNDLATRLARWLARDDVVGRRQTWGGTVARSGYPINSTVGATGDSFADFGNALLVITIFNLATTPTPPLWSRLYT